MSVKGGQRNGNITLISVYLGNQVACAIDGKRSKPKLVEKVREVTFALLFNGRVFDVRETGDSRRNPEEFDGKLGKHVHGGEIYIC